jgi:hypothetical protein
MTGIGVLTNNELQRRHDERMQVIQLTHDAAQQAATRDVQREGIGVQREGIGVQREGIRVQSEAITQQERTSDIAEVQAGIMSKTEFNAKWHNQRADQMQATKNSGWGWNTRG